jgi:hypothetical protein
MTFHIDLIPTAWVRFCLRFLVADSNDTANSTLVLIGACLLRLAPKTAVIEICKKLRDGPTQVNQNLLMYALYAVALSPKAASVLPHCLEEWSNLSLCPTPPRSIVRRLVNLVEVVKLDRAARAAILYRLNHEWAEFGAITAPALARCIEGFDGLIASLLLDLEGLLASTQDRQAAALALACMKRVNPLRLTALQRAAIGDEDDSVRRYAVIALARMDFDRASKTVVARKSEDPSLEVRLAAAEALSPLFKMEVVTDTLKSAAPTLSGLYLLIRYLVFGTAEAVPEILENLTEEPSEHEITIAALWHLWEGASEAAFREHLSSHLPTLMEAFDVSTGEFALYLAELIAHARAETSVLDAVTNHKSHPGLEAFAAQILVAMLHENPLFLPKVLRLSASEDAWVRDVANQALTRTGEITEQFESLRALTSRSEVSRWLESYRLIHA